jgi:hypothetical protein
MLLRGCERKQIGGVYKNHKISQRVFIYTSVTEKKGKTMSMENFYFDSSVAEGLDLLENKMSEVREVGGRVWFTFVHRLSLLLTIHREELSETTYDPVVTVNSVRNKSGLVEILGSITTYQKCEGVFSIIQVVVGGEEYSREPSTQMLSSDKKLEEEYPNWSFSDWISDEETDIERGVTVEGNDEGENEEENSDGGSFVVATSQIGFSDDEENTAGGSDVVSDSE